MLYYICVYILSVHIKVSRLVLTGCCSEEDRVVVGRRREQPWEQPRHHLQPLRLLSLSLPLEDLRLCRPLGLGPPVLEPDLDLRVCELEAVGHLLPLLY